MSDIQDEAYSELCEENARLKVLLTRAADALHPYQFGFPDGDRIRELTLQLRHAAE